MLNMGFQGGIIHRLLDKKTEVSGKLKQRPMLAGMFGGVLAVALILLIGFIYADTLTIPNKTYGPGDPILSSEWNANFTTIEGVVNNNLDDSNFKNDGMTASAKIINGTIDTAALGTNSVTGVKILNGTIQGTKLTNATISQTQMAVNSVSGSQIADNTIPESDINFDNAPQDNYFAKYQSSNSKMKWETDPCAVFVSFSTGDVVPTTGFNQYFDLSGNSDNSGFDPDWGSIAATSGTISLFRGSAVDDITGGVENCEAKVLVNDSECSPVLFITMDDGGVVKEDSDTCDFSENDIIKIQVVEPSGVNCGGTSGFDEGLNISLCLKYNW